MGQRSDELAARFDETHEQVLSTVEELSPTQLLARCDGEDCSVAALASHIATVYSTAAVWATTAARGGQMPTVTMDAIDRTNEEQFARDGKRTGDELVRELRAVGELTSETLRAFSESDLDREVEFSLMEHTVTAAWIIENGLINHVQEHLQSIIAAGSGDGAP